METPPELPRAPSPVPAPLVAAVPVAAAAVPVSSKAPSAADPEDKCELASSREETVPTPSATACPEPAAPPAAEEPGAEVCAEPSSAVASPSDAPVPVQAEPGVISDMSSTRATEAEPVAEVAQAEAAALTVELEPREAPSAELESAPSPPSAPHAAPSPPPTPPPLSPPVSVAAVTTTPSPPPLPSPSALPVVQGDLGEEKTRTTVSEEVKDTEKKEETETDGQLEESQEALSVNSSKSPVPGKHWALWVHVVNCRMKERGFFFLQQMFLFLSAKEKSLVVPCGCCDC